MCGITEKEGLNIMKGGVGVGQEGLNIILGDFGEKIWKAGKSLKRMSREPIFF